MVFLHCLAQSLGHLFRKVPRQIQITFLLELPNQGVKLVADYEGGKIDITPDFYVLCTSQKYLPQKYLPGDILDQSQTPTTCFQLNEWMFP